MSHLIIKRFKPINKHTAFPWLPTFDLTNLASYQRQLFTKFEVFKWEFDTEISHGNRSNLVGLFEMEDTRPGLQFTQIPFTHPITQSNNTSIESYDTRAWTVWKPLLQTVGAWKKTQISSNFSSSFYRGLYDIPRVIQPINGGAGLKARCDF